MKTIRTFHDPILSKVCDPFDFAIDDARTINDMLATLKSARNGVGLAAPQIGWAKRVIVLRPERMLPPVVLINPIILECSERTETDTEGCLSYPGVYAPIERHWSVRVRYKQRDGTGVTRLFTGYDARIVQHEVDHLNGICRVGDAWRVQQETATR